MREFWKTGVVLLLAAGLFAFYWLYERKQEPKPDTESTKVTLLTVDKAKAKELKVSAKGGDTIDVVKEGTFWKLTAPFAAPADTSAVESMFTSLEKLEADELVAAEVKDFAQYGLEAPNRSVVAVVEGAPAPLAVDFGAKAPDGSSVYARKPGETKVYLVASWVEGSFDKKPFDLRDRDLLHVKRDDVRSLEIAGPDDSYALARSESGEWAFTKPLATRAGRWAVDGLLGTIEGLRMESVAGENVGDPKDVARYGLAKPTRSVTLVTKDGASRTLELGAPAPDPNPSPSPTPSPSPSPAKKGEPPAPPKPTKYYARQAGSGLVAVVPAALADDLAKGMAELRAKRLLEVATYETEGFEVTAAGATKKYAKSSTKDKDGLEKTQWRRTAPDAKELDTTKVEDALFKIGGVDVSEFIDAPRAPADYGLDAPVLRVTLKAKGDSGIELGKKDASYYARRTGDAAILKVDATKAEELLKAFGEI